MNLPYERERFCVWMDKASAANLRELIMAAQSAACARLAFKLYEALLRMHLAETDAINVPLLSDEILLINSLVKNKHWATSEMLLLQTWQVAYEQQHGVAFRVDPRTKPKTEESNAIHSSGPEGEGAGAAVWRG